jgi:hypothetical protein
MGCLSESEFRTLDRKLDRLLQMVEAVLGKEFSRMSQALDDLATQVAANTSVEESAVTLINGLAAQLAAAGTDPAKLQSLQASLKASADDLAAAVAANTVADPNTPPSGAQG